MNKVTVSVVVCSYNQEKYIKQTLDSIISQDNPYTWELIVCDDASKDNTPKIIKDYAKIYEEIIPILRSENLGIIKNLFDGISKCKGEYIMVCGGDDYYLPNKIRNQIDYLKAHNHIGLVHSDVQIINEDGKVKGSGYGRDFHSLIDVLNNYSVKAPTMTFRKKDLDQYISEVNPVERGWLMEDVPMTLWFSANNKIAYLPGKMVSYRIIDNSISHQKSAEKILEFEKSAFSVLKFFQNKYKKNLTLEFIYRRQLNNLLKRQTLVENCSEYCNEMYAELQKINPNNSYTHLAYRIRYPKFNLLYIILQKINRKIRILARSLCN